GQPRHVLENKRLVGEQTRDHQRQRCVLGARNRDRAIELSAAADANAIHRPLAFVLVGKWSWLGNPSGPTRRDLAAPDLALQTNRRTRRRFLYGPSGSPCKASVTHRLAAQGHFSASIPAESWGLLACSSTLRPLACALRRLRLSRNAAARRRCAA